MRTPITIETPPAAVAKLLRDRMRATSDTYAYLVTTAGLGVAEAWIEALAWGRGTPPRWGVADGWYLYASGASEAMRCRQHPRASAPVLAVSRRAWDQAQADYNAGPLAAAWGTVER